MDEVQDEPQLANSRLEQKVRELDATTSYLKNILSNISQGLLFISLAGTITTYNRAAERILGIEAIEVLYRRYDTIFSDDLFGFSMKQALEQRRDPTNPLYISYSRGGEIREIEVDAHLVVKEELPSGPASRDDDLGFASGLIILFRDVTEMQKLRRQTERDDRLKALGEMASMVAHEIRNPLGGIKGFASLLQRDLQDQPNLKQMATYIIEGTENLSRLVTNVLNYSRPVNARFETLDLIPLIIDLVYAVRMDSTLSQGIDYTFNPKIDSVLIAVDASLLRAVLLNLVTNAVQAMPDKGAITITVRQDDHYAIVDIADTGVGIPQTHLEKIFAPFFTTKPNGSGFGLTEALKIVRAHGGLLEVISQEGKGTTFTVKLPKTQ